VGVVRGFNVVFQKFSVIRYGSTNPDPMRVFLCQHTEIRDILILKTIPKIFNSVFGLLLAFVIMGEFLEIKYDLL